VVAASVAVVTGTVVTGTGPHGGDEDARRFGFEIESVARVHGLAVIIFVALVLALAGRLQRSGAAPEVLRRTRHLLAVACAQGAVGYVQYFTDVPVLLVGIHILGATLVWAATWRVVLACRVRDDVAAGVPTRLRARQTV
jgi:cytochrome c oxidase assembly protein subunit 15